MLPGLRELILEAIPERFRPFSFDVVTSDNPFLHAVPERLSIHQAMKTLVQEGLRLLYTNRKLTRGRALISNPPDETRRSLAIGILQEDVQTGAPETQFHPHWPLLVEADGESINPEQDLVYEETNPTAKGFFIGFNYTGTNKQKQSEYDPPLPFLRVQMVGGEAGDFRLLGYVFRQKTASEIFLQRVELQQSANAPCQTITVDNVPQTLSQGQELDVPLGDKRKLQIRIRPYPFQEDFRLKGKIDADTIDSDAHL